MACTSIPIVTSLPKGTQPIPTKRNQAQDFSRKTLAIALSLPDLGEVSEVLKSESNFTYPLDLNAGPYI